MLFRRDIDPSCAYCVSGTHIGFGEVACIKRGIMDVEGSCNAFRYEPTKRQPEFPQNQILPTISANDLAI